MLRILSSIRGVITLLLIAINILFWSLALFVLAFIMYIVPNQRWRRWWHKIIYALPELWTDCNKAIFWFTIHADWQVEGIENLNRSDWYLMIANHQSWLDILVITHMFNRKIPTLRFFMKRELNWQLPIVAQACAILDYPIMQRYSKDFLKKHPELKGKDIEATRKSCRKFKNIPTTMIIFPEGSRFSETRHKQQQSPYKHLLKPKSGGVAFILEAMGQYLHTLLDVTIVYPERTINFWDFLCGRTKKIVVNVKSMAITQELLGNYENREYRAKFQKWLNNLWAEKDLIMEQLSAPLVEESYKEQSFNHKL